MLTSRQVRYLLILGLFCFVPWAVAQNPVTQNPATMTLTGVGKGYYMGAVYVDPYTATINGVSGVAVICDDFLDETYLNESWNANVLDVANVTSTSSQKFKSSLTFQSTTYTIEQEYNAAAWLAEQLVSPVNLTNPTAEDEISFALWQMFDPSTTDLNAPYLYLENHFSTTSPSLVPAGITFSQVEAAIANWEAQALANSNGNYSNVYIYTPTATPAPTCSGGPCPSAPPQEFLVVTTPESAAVPTLAADLLALLGAIYIGRRHIVRKFGTPR